MRLVRRLDHVLRAMLDSWLTPPARRGGGRDHGRALNAAPALLPRRDLGCPAGLGIPMTWIRGQLRADGARGGAGDGAGTALGARP
jgi:hypothetical protein